MTHPFLELADTERNASFVGNVPERDTIPVFFVKSAERIEKKGDDRRERTKERERVRKIKKRREIGHFCRVAGELTKREQAIPPGICMSIKKKELREKGGARVSKQKGWLLGFAAPQTRVVRGK
jgi:hypothetical protein